MVEAKVSEEMIARYHELQHRKKEIEAEMNLLKQVFHTYFDNQIGEDQKGEIIEGKFKLQRHIRVSKKYDESTTIRRLEELHMNDLIQTVKKPDEEKIQAAINLGLLQAQDLDGCVITRLSKALTVKELY